MCIERQNAFSFFLCLMFFKPQTGPSAPGRRPEALNEKAEAFLTVAVCHHGRREDTESSVHWKDKIWKILYTRDFQDNFLEKGRSVPHGGRMSPWSSRGHRIFGALDGKNWKILHTRDFHKTMFSKTRPWKSSSLSPNTLMLRWGDHPEKTLTNKAHNLKEPHFHSPNCLSRALSLSLSLSLSRSARLDSARTRCLAFLCFSFCICSISWGIVFNLISFHFFSHCLKNMRMTLFWHATRSWNK